MLVSVTVSMMNRTTGVGSTCGGTFVEAPSLSSKSEYSDISCTAAGTYQIMFSASNGLVSKMLTKEVIFQAPAVAASFSFTLGDNVDETQANKQDRLNNMWLMRNTSTIGNGKLYNTETETVSAKVTSPSLYRVDSCYLRSD